MIYIDYNFESVKKENPELYKSIDFNMAKILKKYNTNMYRLFASYLASNKQDKYIGDKLRKYIYSLYLNSLGKDDLKELKFLNKNINKLINLLEFEFLATFTETEVLNIPPMQKDTNIVIGADKIMLRDKNGFYSVHKNIQDKIDRENVIFDTLNSYLINKETIMNGNRDINSKILNRKEVLVLSNYLGYGSTRENLLSSQTRIKEKTLTKTKDL